MELQDALEILSSGKNTNKINVWLATVEVPHTCLDNQKAAVVKQALNEVESSAKREGLSPSHISQLMRLIVHRGDGGKISEFRPGRRIKAEILQLSFFSS